MIRSRSRHYHTRPALFFYGGRLSSYAEHTRANCESVIHHTTVSVVIAALLKSIVYFFSFGHREIGVAGCQTMDIHRDTMQAAAAVA